MNMNWILASGSPRRRELLALVVPHYQVVTSDADEAVAPGLTPEQSVVAIARQKALAVAQDGHGADLVIGADTIVVVDGEILGKPHTKERATEMLRQLRGRSHLVHTAVQVFLPEDGAGPRPQRQLLSTTQVEMAPMTDREIWAYVESGEPLDKAGAYGIQGLGSRFITKIVGDYYTVMGLPVQGLYQLLRDVLPANPQD